jgi:hypothetical protein
MNISDIFRRQSPAERSLPDGADLLAGILAPGGERTPAAVTPDAERIRAIAQDRQAESIAFQSIALTSLQMLERVIQSERCLASAAISLAQREKLDTMAATLESAADALRDTLSRRGSKVMNLYSPCAVREGEHSWWFALTDTMHVLEEGTAWISTAVSGQPKGCATRVLSGVIARLLHSHYNKLLAEANQWME